MTNQQRARLESLADELEAIAREPEVRETKKHMRLLGAKIPTDLFALAWDIKQIARWNTSSFGM